jgi:hypothetical protein
VRRAVLFLVALAAPAFADDTKPLRVTAQLDGDTARFSVRYLVHAPTGADGFGLPEKGLVVAATVTEGGTRHVLELLEADKASEQFNAIYETVPGRSPRWAALIDADGHTGTFTMSFATPRQATLVADVEIAAPTCYHGDARYVAVPIEWKSRLPVQDAASPDACGEAGDQRMWLRFAAGELATKRGGAQRIGTYAGRVALGRTQVVKLEMNLAGKLSEVPADLATALVVDASRSMTSDELEAQRDTIVAYLRAAPSSRVQVIAYTRGAKALLPSWTTASQASARIDRELRALQRANGSNIEEGLREAGRWLDQVKGTRRIVLFTDENLTTIDEHTHVVDEAVPPKTLVHVVALGGDGLARDDEAKLARVAAKTRGISMRGGHAEDGKLDATELVRPIRLDHVFVRTPGWKEIETDRACPDPDDEFATHSLDEGSACTWWGTGDAVASPFVVEGVLWNEPVTRVVRADLTRSREVVRELSAMFVLDEELQKLAERAARAVNSVWSLYATWGGDDGYEDGYGFGHAGWGSVCGCNGDDVGHGFGTGTMRPTPDLAAEFTRVAAKCRSAYSADVEVETTLEEIVDVDVKSASRETAACIENALWSAWMVIPGAPQRTITRFQLPAL